MNTTMKYMVCDECGKTVEQQLTPIQYGCNPYIGWIRVDEVGETLSIKKILRGDFCSISCLMDTINSTNK